MSQENLFDVSSWCFRQYRKRVLSYAERHRNEYKTYATLISNGSPSWKFLWSRALFSILSARERFAVACEAFTALNSFGVTACAEDKGSVRKQLKACGILYPNVKANYVNKAAKLFQAQPFYFLKQPSESWKSYAERCESIPGLGIAKARFFVALTNPLEADVACIDTWVGRVFLGRLSATFREDSLRERRKYERIEARIRRWGKMVGVSTFLMQWMLWDSLRESKEPHSVLRMPGGHKDEILPSL